MDIVSSKVCNKCGAEKKTSDFRINRKECRKCEAEYTRRYTKEHPNVGKMWNLLNPGKLLLKYKRYRERHAEEIKERNKKYAKENPEKISERNRKHYERNKEKIDAYRAEYRRNKPEIKKAIDQKRRAAKKNGGAFTAKEWKDLCEKYDNKCLCCKEKKNLTPDHVMPLSKGGLNTIENIQPLCLSCNSRKYNKYIDYR